MRSTSYQVMKMQQQEHARGKSCAVEPCSFWGNGNETMGRKRKKMRNLKATRLRLERT